MSAKPASKKHKTTHAMKTPAGSSANSMSGSSMSGSSNTMSTPNAGH
ncbi:MAG: hypothetical protein WBQ17_13420 [Rhizomicrobium sp.]